MTTLVELSNPVRETCQFTPNSMSSLWHRTANYARGLSADGRELWEGARDACAACLLLDPPSNGGGKGKGAAKGCETQLGWCS